VDVRRGCGAGWQCGAWAHRLLGVEVVPDVGGGAGVGHHEVDDKAAGAGGDVGVDTAPATGAGGNRVGRSDDRVRGGAVRGAERDGTLRAAAEARGDAGVQGMYNLYPPFEVATPLAGKEVRP
jgi:hypothetical protein